MADDGRARRSRTAASRVLGAGARAGERLAGATGVDQAVEDAVEEAIVRALRSPAVERAIVRVIVEQNAVQTALEEALTSDEVAEAIVEYLDTPAADQVWREILASPKAQMLVERIADAPEVRAAITQQGMGLVTDLGRRLTAITERVDDAVELVVHRILRKPGHEAETDEVGLITRAVAAAIDLALIGLALSLGSTFLASVIPALKGDSGGVSVFGLVGFTALGVWLGGAAFVAFWSLIGRTPGMSLLSIHLEAGGSREIGLRRALKRIFAVPLALIPLGLGFFAIVTSGDRRGWHDRIAGTKVVYDGPGARAAPWSTLDEGATSGTPDAESVPAARSRRPTAPDPPRPE
jgi:uncharacterized RDD family membrane protein YckC